jgi:hypothetical protein
MDKVEMPTEAVLLPVLQRSGKLIRAAYCLVFWPSSNPNGGELLTEVSSSCQAKFSVSSSRRHRESDSRRT